VTDVDRLYAVPLEDFVAERKQVAKELRAAGDREAAAEVAKLPKPTPPAWALNRLAREEPDAVAEWLDAAATLREASANPGAGLREAMAGHREATRKLLATVRDRTRPAGRPLSEPMLDRVRDLLQAATADPEQAEALRRGVIVEPAGEAAEAGEPPALTAAGEGDEAADRGAAPRASSRADAKRAAREATPAAPREPSSADAKRAAKEREAERKAREKAERLAELERHVEAAEDELARLRDEAAEREAAAAAADERLDEARRALHRSESEAAAARDAADEASAAVATAERELQQLARQLRNASS
jgi:hypothetical protein